MWENIYNYANPDINVCGNLIFLTMESSVSYFELTGFAEARMDVLAFNVVIMPDLAIERVCCSYLYDEWRFFFNN